jgi:CubicO group peptidase (beta-lactamase class C family)
VWGLPRSVGPAGLITASVHDVLTFARLHVEDGVTANGTRLLSRDSVATMQRPHFEIGDGWADTVGLTWRMNRWDGRQIIGHDGGTIGQSAFLRIDPQARVAACLLTNSPEAQGLYQRLFAEIFSACAGITVPAAPGPAAGPAESDLARHAGRYERTSRRLDVSVRDGRLHIVSATTDALAAFGDEAPQEFDLHPADIAGRAGDHFVCRLYDHQPWTPAIFGRLGDRTPYLYLGGRITPRAG